MKKTFPFLKKKLSASYTCEEKIVERGIFKPGQKVLSSSITCKEDALSILENGYQLTADIFSEVQKHLPNIFLAGIDRKIILNCKVRGESTNKLGEKIFLLESNENINHKWSTPASDICKQVNNNQVLLAFSE